MNVSTYTISLNVADVAASADFVCRHLGFDMLMQVDDAVSVQRPNSDFSIAYLTTGLPSFKPAAQARDAAGLLVAFTVDDIDAHYQRMIDAGVAITTPIETEPWQERYFQITDPNGIVYQLVQWMTPDGRPPF